MMFRSLIFAPELILALVLFLFAAGEIRVKNFSNRFALPFLGTGLAGAAVGLFFLGKTGGSVYSGTFTSDPFACFFKYFFLAAAVPVLVMSRVFFCGRPDRTAEFFLIFWSCLLGLFVTVSAQDFLVLFIGLEIVSLSFYVMTAYLRNDSSSAESGIKYLLLGSLASAFLIYGISLFYVLAGTTGFEGVKACFSEPSQRTLCLAAFLFVVSGIGFKIAAAPFHLWVPDVYQGAPSPVVAYLSVASKAAATAVLVRLTAVVFVPLGGIKPLLFSGLAAITLIYGNFGALGQTNLKRLFGYSSIGHAGYLLLGIATENPASAESVLYYLIAFGAANLAVFFVITLVEKETGSAEIGALAGLSRRAPFLAAVMFAAVLSLAGIPPLAGFFGKFYILAAAVQTGLYWLALLGAMMVAVSLYYYLNIVKIMYVSESFSGTKPAVTAASKIILTLLTGVTLAAGLWQTPFLGGIQNAVIRLLGPDL